MQQNIPPTEKSDVFTIGIIFNGFNATDIAFYKEDLIAVRKVYSRKQLRLVIFGYTPATDKTGMLSGLEGEFEYLPPVSLVHWPKQLELANINLLFVPLVDNVFNDTSETWSKYLEGAMLHIPLLVPNISTYRDIITDQDNGFLYPPHDLKNYLLNLLQTNINVIGHCGHVANDRVKKHHTFDNPNNIQAIAMAYGAE